MIVPKLEGVPLGLLPGTEYDEVKFTAKPGDLIVLYSDGIQDQQNPAGDDYGEVRLRPLVQQMCLKPARSVAKAILGDLDKFRVDRDVADDQTLIVMKVKEA
jgi:sigma-B regulation protein RsbU (phosphoserine phosphatase)